MALKFKAEPGPIPTEFLVTADSGKEKAVLAAFEEQASAVELADLLNFLAGLRAQCRTCNAPSV